jgi:DNA-binding MarR family transcriptional regulator
MEPSTLYSAIEVFRNMDPEIHAQTVQTFLLVASKDPTPVKMTALGRALGIAQSSVTRNVQLLSHTNRYGKEGHDLLRSWVNPKNQREKFVELTSAGRRLVTVLQAIK